MDWRSLLLAPAAIVFNGAQVAYAERTTQQYLQNISDTSCLEDLDQALSPVLESVDNVNSIFAKFATQHSGGRAIWNERSFATYMDARLASNTELDTFVPLLWRILLSGAYYPFLAPHDNPEVDLEAFRRAFAFLVMRGFELLGAKQNGRELFGTVENSQNAKRPRLSRIFFHCLSASSHSSSSGSQASHKARRLQDIKDTIGFTQPITYDSYPQGPTVGEEHFDSAASRLLDVETELPTAVQGSSRTLLKSDLQQLLQLLLRLRLGDKRWRHGVCNGDISQRSGDVYYSHFVLGLQEALSTSDLANSLMTSLFGDDGESVLWEGFSTWCSNCPVFSFLFFQLWASILAPNATTSSPSRILDTSYLPTSITNLFCLLNVAKLESESRPRYRFHDNELQLLLDLQASILVADLATKPEFNEVELHKTLTCGDWFHILLIRGEELGVETPAQSKKSRLIAAFLSPPGKVIFHVEKQQPFEYAWRSSIVQLEPDLTITNSGGMSAHLIAEVLELRSHGTSIDHSTNIVLDWKQRLVTVAGHKPSSLSSSVASRSELPDSTETTLKLQLRDLKCYRLPVESLEITRHPSVMDSIS